MQDIPVWRVEGCFFQELISSLLLHQLKGYPAGLGAHTVQAMVPAMNACIEETIEFVRKVNKPVVGFKVLAGGALIPEDGFQWAFDNGADFIEVGMFDFQIVENVIQTIQSVEKAKSRSRPWFG